MLLPISQAQLGLCRALALYDFNPYGTSFVPLCHERPPLVQGPFGDNQRASQLAALQQLDYAEQIAKYFDYRPQVPLSWVPSQCGERRLYMTSYENAMSRFSRQWDRYREMGVNPLGSQHSRQALMGALTDEQTKVSFGEARALHGFPHRLTHGYQASVALNGPLEASHQLTLAYSLLGLDALVRQTANCYVMDEEESEINSIYHIHVNPSSTLDALMAWAGVTHTKSALPSTYPAAAFLQLGAQIYLGNPEYFKTSFSVYNGRDHFGLHFDERGQATLITDDYQPVASMEDALDTEYVELIEIPSAQHSHSLFQMNWSPVELNLRWYVRKGQERYSENFTTMFRIIQSAILHELHTIDALSETERIHAMHGYLLSYADTSDEEQAWTI